MLLIQLNLHKAATLGVLARGCFIEVGYSKKLRHLQQKHLNIIMVHMYNWSSPSNSDCIIIFFQHYILEIMPNYIVCVSSVRQLFNRGDNNRRTLVGTAKRWLQPLNRGLSSHSFLFWDYWLLNRGWPLYGGSN